LGQEKKIVWRVMPKLMADPDPEVWQMLLQQITDVGVEALANLEKIWENTMQEQVQRRAEEAINASRRQRTLSLLRTWLGKPDELRGALEIVHLHFFPHLDWGKLMQRLKTWVSYLPTENRNAAKADEKIKLLNHLFYEVKMLKPGDNTKFRHCFMHTLLEHRIGSSCVHAGLYMLAAQEINLPLTPAKIPGTCLLRWERQVDSVWKANELKNFVSPYGLGARFSERELDHYFKQLKQDWWLLEPVDQHPNVFWMQTWLEEIKASLERNKSGLFYEDIQVFQLGLQGL